MKLSLKRQMKLSQYLRIKTAGDLDYNPDEAQALLEQSQNYNTTSTSGVSPSAPTMADQIQDSWRMLQNPSAYFDQVDTAPAERAAEDPREIYARGIIDAQNVADAKADKARLNELSRKVDDVRSDGLPRRLVGAALGAATGGISSFLSSPELGPLDTLAHTRLAVIPLVGTIGATNAAYLARSLGASKRVRLLSALAGGALHSAANVYANSGTGFGEGAKYPLLSKFMQIYNPIAGGIAGWLSAGKANELEYEDALKAYNEQAHKNAKNRANRQPPLYPNVFK